MDYADQRYYDRGSGRFLTVDPGGIATADLGNPGSWNRYAYVYGDPVNYADPAGTVPCYVGGPASCTIDVYGTVPDPFSGMFVGGGGGRTIQNLAMQDLSYEYWIAENGGGGGAAALPSNRDLLDAP